MRTQVKGSGSCSSSPASPGALCYSPDGSLAAVASDGLVLKGGVLPGEVMVWDTPHRTASCRYEGSS